MNLKINGKDVKLTLLPGAQVLASSTYSLSGGWDGNPLQDAIVRIWKTQDTKLLDNIETSVDFLKDVRILLFSVGFTIGRRGRRRRRLRLRQQWAGCQNEDERQQPLSQPAPVLHLPSPEGRLIRTVRPTFRPGLSPRQSRDEP